MENWADVVFGKSAEADSIATSAPVPQIQVMPTPAAGKRGPIGTAPRTNYSRVNTGAPETSDAGAQVQKSMEPKVAAQQLSEVSMNNMAARPTLQQMLKTAMAGASIGSTKIAEEAKRQLENLDVDSETVQAKHAATQTDSADEGISTDYARKLASAAEYCAELLVKESANLGGQYGLTESKVEPGKGPGALTVLESPSGPSPSEDVGQARRQPPLNPGLRKALASGTDAATQLDADYDRRPGQSAEAGWAPMGDHSKLSMAQQIKTAAGAMAKEALSHTEEGHKIDAAVLRIRERHAVEMAKELQDLDIMGYRKDDGSGTHVGSTRKAFGTPLAPLADLRHLAYAAAKHEAGENAWNPLGGTLTPHKSEGPGASHLQFGRFKKASAQLIRKTAAQLKQAEDAANPAHISAGAAVAPVTSEAGQPGPAASGKDRVPTTAQGVADYTRRAAKAPEKADMRRYLDEPMQSAADDKVLEHAFGHTGEAGAKISSVQELSKTAAARGLMQKLAEAAGVNPVTYR